MKIFQHAIMGMGRIAWSLEKDSKREKPCTHLGSISENPHSQLAAICEIDKQKVQALKKEFPSIPIYPDLAILRKNHSIDILHIATPTKEHYKNIFQAIDLQFPLIYSEKPICSLKEDLSQLKNRLINSPTFFFINHERHYANDYLRAKQLVKNKTYGKLLSVQAKLYMDHDLSSVILHDGTHLLDIIQFICADHLHLKRTWGDIRVSAVNKKNYWVMATANNVDVMIEFGTGRTYLSFELDLSFEKGHLKIGNGIYQEYKADVSPFYQKAYSLKRQYRFRFKKTEYFRNTHQAAIDLLKQNNENERKKHIYDAFTTMDIIKKILLSSSS